jgi:hypothetical protein
MGDGIFMRRYAIRHAYMKRTEMSNFDPCRQLNANMR